MVGYIWIFKENKCIFYFIQGKKENRFDYKSLAIVITLTTYFVSISRPFNVR